MADLLDTPEFTKVEPKWQPFLKEIDHILGDYNPKEDTLFICRRGSVARPAVSLDVDGEYWLRLDPQTHEVLGIEIEAFQTHFLVEHPDLAAVWYGARRWPVRLIKRHPEKKASIIAPVVQKLEELFRSDPRQFGFT